MTETQEHDAEERVPDRPMTRDEWIAYQIAQAPEITPEAWQRTLQLLRGSRRRRRALDE